MSLEQSLQLALQYQMSGRLQEAQTICRQILSTAPNHPAAMHLLGAIAIQSGNFAQAVELLGKVVAIQTQNPGAHTSLGIALMSQNKLDEAIKSFNRAIALNANFAKAHCNLGVAMAMQRNYQPAITSFSRAIAIQPGYPEALSNLGSALTDSGSPKQAIAPIQQALKLRPNYAEAHYNLGNAYSALKQYGPATQSYQRALQIRPDYAKPVGNLANALSQVGRLDESMTAYRRAVSLNPDDAQIHSNLILTMHYSADHDPAAIGAELARWNQMHAAPLAGSIVPPVNDRSPDRRLRIGYVSPDFCRHSVARFILPVLKHHDHPKFEIVCYASVVRPDDVSEKLKGHADAWHDVAHLSDEALANQIRRDRIDVLVDLALHTGRNRLLTFARKPAPVQMTYLAYCGSSGMRTMDYRLTDSFLDPAGIDESVYSEKSLRLKSYWCYQPTGEEPPPGPLAVTKNGHITFGCLNNFAKVTPIALRTWARLMDQVPGSRLILHMPAPEMFVPNGLDMSRVTLQPAVSTQEYFSLYQQMDIALDPYPFGGGTTSCDALWMGVPVVSCTGQTAVSRAGSSILSNIGLSELVANTLDDYVRIATNLAGDLRRLSELRNTLRQRMQQSQLTNATQFTADLESLYRMAWRNWCEA